MQRYHSVSFPPTIIKLIGTYTPSKGLFLHPESALGAVLKPRVRAWAVLTPWVRAWAVLTSRVRDGTYTESATVLTPQVRAWAVLTSQVRVRGSTYTPCRDRGRYLHPESGPGPVLTPWVRAGCCDTGTSLGVLWMGQHLLTPSHCKCLFPAPAT